VIAKVEHHLGELFPRRDQPGGRPLLQPARDRGAVDQGGRGSHSLDPALLSPIPGQWGPPAARGHRLQPRQSAPPACSARRYPDLVPHEPPAAAVQDGRAADTTCPVLHAAACRKLLDTTLVPADRCAHRAARVAPDV